MEQTDWGELKTLMASPYGSMKLQCDQFEVSLVQETDRKSRRWLTAVYVDGYFKGEWTTAVDGEAKHEEARRFLRKVSKALYSKAEIELSRKVFGKREADRRATVRFIYFVPSWTSFNALKKHLLANNASIQRIH